MKENLGPEVRKILLTHLEKELNGATEVGLLLSGGLDSNVMLWSLQHLGVTVRAYTFSLPPMSTDLKLAIHNAKTFGVDHTIVRLPNDLDKLMEDIRWMAEHLDSRKKVEFTCVWPLLCTFRKHDEDVWVTGLGADAYFVNSRFGAEVRDTAEGCDWYRNKAYLKGNPGQRKQTVAVAQQFNSRIIMPFLDPRLLELFSGLTHDELNKPRQKQPYRDAFPMHWRRSELTPHQNMQKGDSGIDDQFSRLVGTPYNKGRHKSVVGIINDVRREVSA